MIPIPEAPMMEVDDDTILQALDHVCSPQSYQAVLYGALCAVCRSYTKGAQRDPFIDTLEHACRLFDLMARIKFLHATKILLSSGDPIKPENLDASLAWMTTEAESTRKKLVENMRLVKKIAPPGVRKH